MPWLVSTGLVVAYRKYSTVYVEDEDSARRGLRAGEFVEPSDWRAERAHGR